MSIITLISDWGTSDYYVAAVKGVIYKQLRNAQIIDISHDIKPFNSTEAAYVLKNSYHHFPIGTIHIIGVNTEESLANTHTVVYYDGHYFIGCDDGIFSLIFDGEPDAIYEIDIPLDSSSFTFSSRDRFAKVAVHIAKGGKIEELGAPRESLNSKLLFNPPISSNLLRGMVIHIDNYQNLITNINKSDFTKFTKGSKYEISLKTKMYSIKKISDSYNNVGVSEIVALFTGNGNLEIAINKGNAASLLGVGIDDLVTVVKIDK